MEWGGSHEVKATWLFRQQTVLVFHPGIIIGGFCGCRLWRRRGWRGVKQPQCIAERRLNDVRSRTQHPCPRFSVYNGAAANWPASSDSSWLGVTSSGITEGLLTLTADPSGLATDTIHYATVAVTSCDADITSSETIRVGFYVSSTDPSASQVNPVPKAYNVVSDPIRPYVYVSHSTPDYPRVVSDVIDIYNIYNGVKVHSIPAGSELWDMAVSSDGQMLYVIDFYHRAVIPVDLVTLTSGTQWPATDLHGNDAMLVYTRFNGMGVLSTSRCEVFDTRNGALVADIPYINGNYYGFILAAAQNGKSFYGFKRGLVGMLDLNRYTGNYSAATDTFSVTKTHTLNRHFGNNKDIAVNPDGSRIYTASGSEDGFPTFILDGSGITEGITLPGHDYPIAVEIGPDGRIYGAMNLGLPNNYTYHSDGTVGDTYSAPGDINRMQRSRCEGKTLSRHLPIQCPGPMNGRRNAASSPGNLATASQ